MKAIKAALGDGACSNILFLHALLGCDTTLHLHGVGKSLAPQIAPQKVIDSPYFAKLTENESAKNTLHNLLSTVRKVS